MLSRLCLPGLVGAAMLSVMAGTGCDSTGDPDSTTDPVLEVRSVPIAYGTTSTLEMRSRVRAFVSAVDSVGAQATKLEVPGVLRPAVLAIGADGRALLASNSSPQGTLILDARSTALFLCRSLLAPRARVNLSEAKFETSVTEHASYPQLLARISALAAEGRSYTESAEVVNLAALITSGAVTFGTVPDAPSSAGDGPPRFATFPVTVTEGSSDIRLTNVSPVSFGVATTRGAFGGGGSVIRAASTCPLCSVPPSVTPVVLPLTGLAEGEEATLSLTFGALQRREAVEHAALEAVGRALYSGGIGLSSTDHAAWVSALGTRLDLGAAAGKGTWAEALQMVLGGIAAQATPLAGVLIEKGLVTGVAPRPFATLLQALLRPYALLAAGGGGGPGTDLAAVGTYWTVGSDRTTVCLEGGLFASCTASVAVTPEQATVFTSGAVTLTATPKDATGQALTGRRVRWSVNNTTVSPASGEGASYRVQAGAVAGSTVVTATVGRVTGQATVEVRAAVAGTIAGTYRLVSYRGVPMGGQCGQDKGCGASGMILDSGTATLTASTWTMLIKWRPPYNPTEVATLYNHTGTLRAAGRTTAPLNVPARDWCVGEHHFEPDFGYCSQLPAGALYEFQFFSTQPFAPYAVLLDDGVTLVSGVGGQTVWVKQ